MWFVDHQSGHHWELVRNVAFQSHPRPWIWACISLRSQVMYVLLTVWDALLWEMVNSPCYWGGKWGLERLKEHRCLFSQCGPTRIPASEPHTPFWSLSLPACPTGTRVPQGFGIMAQNARSSCKTAGSVPRPGLRTALFISCKAV